MSLQIAHEGRCHARSCNSIQRFRGDIPCTALVKFKVCLKKSMNLTKHKVHLNYIDRFSCCFTINIQRLHCKVNNYGHHMKHTNTVWGINSVSMLMYVVQYNNHCELRQTNMVLRLSVCIALHSFITHVSPVSTYLTVHTSFYYQPLHTILFTPTCFGYPS